MPSKMETNSVQSGIELVFAYNPDMDNKHPDELYNEAYYAKYGWSRDQYGYTQAWLSHFAGLATRIVRDFSPKKVLDAGCALGVLVYQLRRMGVDARGIDISKYAIENVNPDIAPFCQQKSISERLAEDYDLICCIEVMEHMTHEESMQSIENICAHTKSVLFSSSPDAYGDPTHINVHSTGEWKRMFLEHRFDIHPTYDASFVAPWAMRFDKRSRS